MGGQPALAVTTEAFRKGTVLALVMDSGGSTVLSGYASGMFAADPLLEVAVQQHGYVTTEDARRAVDAGVDGVIVSNHGGRQLDSVPSTAQALPAVAEAVGDRGTLALLAALTEADSPATGPSAWGSWKAGLVAELPYVISI